MRARSSHVCSNHSVRLYAYAFTRYYGGLSYFVTRGNNSNDKLFFFNVKFDLCWFTWQVWTRFVAFVKCFLCFLKLKKLMNLNATACKRSDYSGLQDAAGWEVGDKRCSALTQSHSCTEVKQKVEKKTKNSECSRVCVCCVYVCVVGGRGVEAKHTHTATTLPRKQAISAQCITTQCEMKLLEVRKGDFFCRPSQRTTSVVC